MWRSRPRCGPPTAPGVEMEALTAVSIAALSLVDMIKAIDKAAVITDVRVLEQVRRPERRLAPRPDDGDTAGREARERPAGRRDHGVDPGVGRRVRGPRPGRSSPRLWPSSGSRSADRCRAGRRTGRRGAAGGGRRRRGRGDHDRRDRHSTRTTRLPSRPPRCSSGGSRTWRPRSPATVSTMGCRPPCSAEGWRARPDVR